MGEAARVVGDLVARGAAAAAAEPGQLRVDEDEGQLVGAGPGPLAHPGPFAVDLEPEGAQVPDLADVEAGERLRRVRTLRASS